MNIKKLINNKDYKGIEEALQHNPELANEGIPYDEVNMVKAHPLHRICDLVHLNTLSEDEALTIARIFLTNGADVNGGTMKVKVDTPLIAAASLGADDLGILYIENDADIHHPGTHGGTALHWAAWCGREKLLKRLIDEDAEMNKLCVDFTSTPLFWAIHGYWSCGRKNPQEYLECARLLLEAGADKTIPNFEGYTVIDMLNETDQEFISLLNGA